MALIILDRDGVINEDSPHYIKSADEWIPIPGSLEAIKQINQKGYKVAVATNQAGLAKGKFDQAALDAMHEKMIRLVEEAGGHIEMIAYCPHHPDENCECRKPKPKLLQEIVTELGEDMSKSFFVGDKLSDIDAARAAGAKPVLVLTGKGQKTQDENPSLNVLVFTDLAAFSMAL